MKRTSIKESFHHFFEENELPTKETRKRLINSQYRKKKERSTQKLLPFLISLLFIVGAVSLFAILNKNDSNKTTLNSSEPTPNIQVPTDAVDDNNSAKQLIEISHIQMMDEKVGWSHFKNMLLKTMDGGITWRKQSPDLDRLNADEYFILTENDVWILEYKYGDGIVTFHITNDGGTTWKNSETNILGSNPHLYFINKQDGWMTTNGRSSAVNNEVFIYETKDGGMNWSFIDSNISLFDGIKGGLHFIDGRKGWMNITTPYTSNILYTNNAGVTWDLQHIHQEEQLYYANELATFVNNQKGLLLSHTQCNEKPCAKFYLTTTGGDTWDLQSNISHSNEDSLLLVDIIDEHSIYATDQLQFFYYSNDFGATWETIKLSELNIKGKIIQMDFLHANLGWAIVQNGEHFNLYKIEQLKNWNPISSTLFIN